MRKALFACNACGALEEVEVGTLAQSIRGDWFKITTHWPGDMPAFQGSEEWIVCSPSASPAWSASPRAPLRRLPSSQRNASTGTTDLFGTEHLRGPRFGGGRCV